MSVCRYSNHLPSAASRLPTSSCLTLLVQLHETRQSEHNVDVECCHQWPDKASLRISAVFVVQRSNLSIGKYPISGASGYVLRHRWLH